MQYFGNTYAKILFIVNLNFEFNWVVCILSAILHPKTQKENQKILVRSTMYTTSTFSYQSPYRKLQYLYSIGGLIEADDGNR